MNKKIVFLFYGIAPYAALGYNGLRFPSFLQFPSSTPTTKIVDTSLSSKTFQRKSDLINAISFTGNGKDASPEKQKQVLAIVRELESLSEPSVNLLTDASIAKKLLDGVWYLQYTSPSIVGEKDEFANEPVFASENGQVETAKFNAKGTVTAAGVTVDTSNRIVKQIFDVENNSVLNEICLDFGVIIRVSGSFRPSENVPRRAIVAFKHLDIEFKNTGVQLKFGWIFSIIAKIRKTDVGGWLETTFIDDTVRIGKGNKGTCFILTRDFDAVAP